ncbi:hypothetical protein THTE_3420 [Thermogutta terrifontis]|uniref:Uncharacterized protein n=1 Tax=Thermogutta terrifontis TaxID=1331910 RepID=A0A286RJD3_9BACT|nr:hypothetical protein THTE_3420 [Thermogutta terrifontis]
MAEQGDRGPVVFQKHPKALRSPKTSGLFVFAHRSKQINENPQIPKIFYVAF